MQIAEMIASYVDFDGHIVWDTSKPSGQLRKPSDNSKLYKLGWRPEMYTDFKLALLSATDWFTINYSNARGV